MGTISQAELYRLIAERNARGERVVVATVGGGCIEAEVWAEAREAMRTGAAGLHKFSLTADEASEEGMVCGGTMEIFIDVWEVTQKNGDDVQATAAGVVLTT